MFYPRGLCCSPCPSSVFAEFFAGFRMVDKCLDPYQRGLVYSPRFRSVQQHGLYICVKQAYFVVSPITFDFHTFLNRWKATLALLILFFTSASVPPCVSTMLPRYLKSLTSSSVSPSSMISVSQVAFVLRIFVFLLLIFNPTRSEINASYAVLSCICLWL